MTILTSGYSAPGRSTIDTLLGRYAVEVLGHPRMLGHLCWAWPSTDLKASLLACIVNVFLFIWILLCIANALILIWVLPLR